MDVKLHRNATTTPRIRAYIQASSATVAELARELGLHGRTVQRWRDRTDTSDRSSAPHRITTGFTPEEEEIAVELRARVGLSLDDILEVMRRCVRATISRSALYRCLVRHGVSALPRPPQPEIGTFRPEPFGFVHIDLKHLTRLEGRPAFVFVAIERTTRFVHVEIVHERSARTIAACLERFLEAFRHPIHTILTDNGSEFTDRFGDARWRKRATGTGHHPFDRVCARAGIAHRLTKPYRPQTNGMVERFNRRIGEAIQARPASRTNLGKNRFRDHAERNAFIRDFVAAYNATRLRCLGHKAPAELITNLPEHNTKAGIHFACCSLDAGFRRHERQGCSA